MSQPCGMFRNFHNLEECGNPATLGWVGELGNIVPICDDCIASTGTKRNYLKRLPKVTKSTTTLEECERPKDLSVHVPKRPTRNALACQSHVRGQQ